MDIRTYISGLDQHPGITVDAAANHVHIHIPPNIIVASPIRIAPCTAVFPEHIKCTIGKGSSVMVTEELRGTSVKNRTWDVEIALEPEAHATYISLQCLGRHAHETSLSYRGVVKSGARMHWHMTSLNQCHTHTNLMSEIVGADAVSDIDWIFYAKGDEQQHLSARNTFVAPRGSGEITLRGVAQDGGYCDCRGMIEIGTRGSGTDTYLTEDVLMLDATAKVDAIPGLEIKTNDVKASHSATVSRVTAEDLFYFASRGIDRTEARRMYVEGFLSGLTERVEDADIRQIVLRALQKKYAESSL